MHIWQNNQAIDSGHKKEEELIKYVEFCNCIWYSVYHYMQ